MTPNAPAWLTAKPIAHRGLHDAGQGVVENTLKAARAAIAQGFAIECDLQMSADGEAMVFHDDALERLTYAEGALAKLGAVALAGVRFRAGGEGMPTLAQLLAAIAGRVALICEIKGGFDADRRLAERAADVAAPYQGALAFKSFDPDIVAHLRAKACPRPLGIVAQARYDDPAWGFLSPAQRRDCANFLHIGRTRPDFLSWSVDDLPHPTPVLLRHCARLPTMVWTVRSQAKRELAGLWADQIIFEGDGRP